MVNKKICWITASYMLQVDLPILCHLNKIFEIDWYLLADSSTPTARMATEYAAEHGISLACVHIPFREIDPRNGMRMRKFIRSIRKKEYGAYYFNTSTFPWLLFIIRSAIRPERVIIAMHHGFPHSGMRFKPLYFPFLKRLNRQPFVLQYFSDFQSKAFQGNDHTKKYVIPLALNHFGNSALTPPEDKVVFTNFGNIIESKNIECLIKASEMLWEEMPGKFCVRIAGFCHNWEERYAPLISHPEAFQLDIRRIAEQEIADLFSSSHYIVLPYKSVTQSGPLRIAYGYDVPVITSDLRGFRESVVEGVTGLMFESDNAEALKEIMKKCVVGHPALYSELRLSLADYVARNLSVSSVCDKYVAMFNNVMKD